MFGVTKPHAYFDMSSSDGASYYGSPIETAFTEESCSQQAATRVQCDYPEYYALPHNSRCCKCSGQYHMQAAQGESVAND